MKKTVLILLMVALVFSCKDEKKTEGTEPSDTKSEITEISGNFMCYDGAAVFHTNNQLFGVVDNDQLETLILQSETLKTKASDEVAVILKVKKSKKPTQEEGWENRIEIFEIIKVSKVDPKDNEIIKLGTNSNAENK